MHSRVTELWPPLGARVAIAHEFRPPPYGGSNQFLLALRAEFRRRGISVGANRITRRTRACILNAFLFDARRISRARRDGCRIVHRVDGPVSRYRGVDDGTDGRVVALNAELADATVFQSRYSLEASQALGLEFRAPVVIPNAVDSTLFYPDEPRSHGRKIRLISTSWSSNPNKGFATYAWLDRHLDFTRFEYTFLGQSPVAFTRIRTVRPVASREVGRLLREHDIYVTASAHESCSNALLEALACGLPALYLESGSNGELVGDGGRPFTSAVDALSQLERLVDEYDQRRSLISIRTLAEVASLYLDVMGIDAPA